MRLFWKLTWEKLTKSIRSITVWINLMTWMDLTNTRPNIYKVKSFETCQFTAVQKRRWTGYAALELWNVSPGLTQPWHWNRNGKISTNIITIVIFYTHKKEMKRNLTELYTIRFWRRQFYQGYYCNFIKGIIAMVSVFFFSIWQPYIFFLFSLNACIQIHIYVGSSGINLYQRWIPHPTS